MPLTDIIAAGAASAQALSAIIPQLNGARSVIIEVDNKTPATLRRVHDAHLHGGFEVTPSSEIPPNMADLYGSQSKAFSIGTGTEGEVHYHGLGRRFSIRWSNPFIGDNEIGVNFGGGNLIPFRIVTTGGSGNTHAHMRYEVFPRAIPWQHAVPGAGREKVSPNTSPTSWYTTPENVQHIAYVGEDRQIHECFVPV